MKILKRVALPVALFAALSTVPAWAGVQQATIQLPSTSNSSPFHSVAIPLAVYANAKDSQLSDLRVRNAAGEYLNYAWLHTSSAGKQQLSLQSMNVPIFPLQLTTVEKDANLMLEVEQGSDGSVRWRSRSGGAKKMDEKGVVDAWLIDASALYRQAANAHTQSYLIQARISVPESFQGVASFSLESSDDLQHWQSIAQHSQILQLRHQEQSLQQLEFNLPVVQAKYLRLRWDQASKAPRILSMQLDAQMQNWTLPSLLWTAAIKPSQCDTKTCEYRVPRNLPVDSVRVKLPQLNSVDQLSLSGVLESMNVDHHHIRHSLNPLYVLRHQKNNHKQSTEYDHYLRNFQAYRLQLDGKEIENEAIPVNGENYLKLRLRSESNNLANAAPEIQIGSVARQLVFLARGAAPYRLEWGQEAQQGAAIEMDMLMPKQADAMGFTSGATVQILNTANEEGASAASASLAAKEKPQENASAAQNKWWLWMALLGAVALLGWMVWSSLAKMDEENKKPN
jgi:hypothetical protein